MDRNAIASALLQINAIKLTPANPFTWASGWKSPIYCDNRMTLSYPKVRSMISQGFASIIREKYPDVEAVAGVATGAIAHGMLVAQELELPFAYVRPTPKGHGLANQIEGVVKPGQRIVVIEDLISTGQSSLNAVAALREGGAEVLGLLAIFTYSFPQAAENFTRMEVYLDTLANYTELISIAAGEGIIQQDDLKLLQAWRESPDTWGK